MRHPLFNKISGRNHAKRALANETTRLLDLIKLSETVRDLKYWTNYQSGLDYGYFLDIRRGKKFCNGDLAYKITHKISVMPKAFGDGLSRWHVIRDELMATNDVTARNGFKYHDMVGFNSLPVNPRSVDALAGYPTVQYSDEKTTRADKSEFFRHKPRQDSWSEVCSYQDLSD